jgi:hypothetical protein
VLDQGAEIFRPLWEGRNSNGQNGQNIEPEQEIGTKGSLPRHGRYVPIRGCDDTNIDRYCPVGTNLQHFPLFEHAQEIRLHVESELADLVE